jgi:hypothetical protein
MVTQTYKFTGEFTYTPSLGGSRTSKESLVTDDPNFKEFATQMNEKTKEKFEVNFVSQVLLMLDTNGFENYWLDEPIVISFSGISITIILDNSNNYEYRNYHAIDFDAIYVDEKLIYNKPSQKDAVEN